MYILSPPPETTLIPGVPSGFSNRVVDSIVFIALGPASHSSSLRYALQSLREEGQWDGPVHVIIEHEGDLDCLLPYIRGRAIETIVASKASNTKTGSSPGGNEDARRQSSKGGPNKDDKSGVGAVAQAKMGKMRLLDLLPPDLRRVLYIDCDIITQRPIMPFLEVVGREWSKVDNEMDSAVSPGYMRGVSGRDNSARTKHSQELSTLLIFPDAAGHTMPLCSGCDKSHSGIVGLERGRSELCLQLWLEAFAGNKEMGMPGTSTDQEALDHALRKGSGCKARWLDARHLRFMKDIFVVLGLVGKRTFAHFTGLLHPDRLSGMHRRHYEASLSRGFEEWGSQGGVVAGCAGGDPPHR